MENCFLANGKIIAYRSPLQAKDTKPSAPSEAAFNQSVGQGQPVSGGLWRQPRPSRSGREEGRECGARTQVGRQKKSPQEPPDAGLGSQGLLPQCPENPTQLGKRQSSWEAEEGRLQV